MHQCLVDVLGITIALFTTLEAGHKYSTYYFVFKTFINPITDIPCQWLKYGILSL